MARLKRPIAARPSETMPTTRPRRSKSGPPARPGFTIVVMIDRSSMYSQNASNGPTKETSPLAPRRSRSPLQVIRKTGSPGLGSSSSASRAGSNPAPSTVRSARPLSWSSATRATGRVFPSRPATSAVDGAEDEVVRGEDVLGGDRDPGAHALLPEDLRRGVLGGDLGAKEGHRGGGDARDGNEGVRDLLREDGEIIGRASAGLDFRRFRKERVPR